MLCAYFAMKPQVKEHLSLSDISNMPQLEIADLVFRQGIDLDSSIIQDITKSPYSHIGMVVSLNPILIIHATTNDLNKQNGVILSSLEDFLKLSKQIAIKRFDLDLKTKEKIANALLKQLGKPFILNAESNNLYCTTLLENELSKYINLDLSYTTINVPILGGEFLFPKAFFEDNHSRLIFKS